MWMWVFVCATWNLNMWRMFFFVEIGWICSHPLNICVYLYVYVINTEWSGTSNYLGVPGSFSMGLWDLYGKLKRDVYSGWRGTIFLPHAYGKGNPTNQLSAEYSRSIGDLCTFYVLYWISIKDSIKSPSCCEEIQWTTACGLLKRTPGNQAILTLPETHIFAP